MTVIPSVCAAVADCQYESDRNAAEHGLDEVKDFIILHVKALVPFVGATSVLEVTARIGRTGSARNECRARGLCVGSAGSRGSPDHGPLCVSYQLVLPSQQVFVAPEHFAELDRLSLERWT